MKNEKYTWQRINSKKFKNNFKYFEIYLSLNVDVSILQ